MEGQKQAVGRIVSGQRQAVEGSGRCAAESTGRSTEALITTGFGALSVTKAGNMGTTWWVAGGLQGAGALACDAIELSRVVLDKVADIVPVENGARR